MRTLLKLLSLENAPFADTAPRPPGGNVYPADLTRAELDAYVAKHAEQKDALYNSFTVIRRQGDAFIAIQPNRKRGDLRASRHHQASPRLITASSTSRPSSIRPAVRSPSVKSRRSDARHWPPSAKKARVALVCGETETVADLL